MRYFPAGPHELLASLWRNRSLMWQLSLREVVGRYRGSIMGISWSFLNPLLMLAVYTFVFSIVLDARWIGAPSDSTFDYAIFLFTGLILHGLLAECVNRAPGCVVSNPNYVKKVVFPLEVLPGVAWGAAGFQAAASLAMLIGVQVLRGYGVPVTIVALPLVLLPIVFASLGLAWFLAGLGVYLRDVGQVTGVLMRMLLYVSAVLYPIAAVPESYRLWLQLNPLAALIEEARKVLLLGVWPDPLVLIATTVLGVAMALAGFAWFQKTRAGFADVL